MTSDLPISFTAPQWGRAALITIDTQRDTLDGASFEVPGTSAALPRMAALVEAFRRAARPVVHMVRIYRPDGANVDLCRRAQVAAGAALLLAGTQGCELAQALVPGQGIGLETDLLLSGGIQSLGPGETVMYKPRWGAFYQTPLEGLLKASGVTTLVFCGANFPNCPRTSIYEASERDFRLVLARDALSGLYSRGEQEMAAIGVTLMDSDQIVSALARADKGA